jgi:FtsP/CotA-like multicopper oxidase with cupredoxin domain
MVSSPYPGLLLTCVFRSYYRSDLPQFTADDGDLDTIYDLVPRVAQKAPTKILTTNILDSKGGSFVDVNGDRFNGFGFNNITFQAQVGYPLLQQVEDGLTINKSLSASIVFPHLGGGDIVLNNLDYFGPHAGGISHPYHLHGKEFSIVARGTGIITSAADLANVAFNTTNPLRRDTLTVAPNTWAVLREFGNILTPS